GLRASARRQIRRGPRVRGRDRHTGRDARHPRLPLRERRGIRGPASRHVFPAGVPVIMRRWVGVATAGLALAMACGGARPQSEVTPRTVPAPAPPAGEAAPTPAPADVMPGLRPVMSPAAAYLAGMLSLRSA